MLIDTRDFGDIEVNDEELITFPAGLFAFEDLRKFALISPLGEDVYPKWLQSVEDLTPCFVVFDPEIIEENYVVKLESFEEKLLKLDGGLTDKNSNDLKFLAIATVPDDFKKTVVNMKAPIVINMANRLATQVILPSDCNYDFRFRLYENSDESSDSKDGYSPIAGEQGNAPNEKMGGVSC